MNDSHGHNSFDWWLDTLGGFAFLRNGYISNQHGVGKFFCLKIQKLQVEQHSDGVYGIDISFDLLILSQALHW